jgi:hypothetical protein
LPYCHTKEGIMPEQLIATAGVWFFAASALQFVAAFVEQAGAPRSPEEDGERKPAARLVFFFASLLTIGLLLCVPLSPEVEPVTRLLVLQTPIAAMFSGAMLGAIFGALAQGVAPTMRKVAIPLALAALALALYVAHPSLLGLANGLLGGAPELPVRPV